MEGLVLVGAAVGLVTLALAAGHVAAAAVVREAVGFREAVALEVWAALVLAAAAWLETASRAARAVMALLRLKG
jgi:hypothetical protein